MSKTLERSLALCFLASLIITQLSYYVPLDKIHLALFYALSFSLAYSFEAGKSTRKDEQDKQADKSDNKPVETKRKHDDLLTQKTTKLLSLCNQSDSFMRVSTETHETYTLEILKSTESPFMYKTISEFTYPAPLIFDIIADITLRPKYDLAGLALTCRSARQQGN